MNCVSVVAIKDTCLLTQSWQYVINIGKSAVNISISLERVPRIIGSMSMIWLPLNIFPLNRSLYHTGSQNISKIVGKLVKIRGNAGTVYGENAGIFLLMVK